VIEELSSQIWARPAFRTEYQDLLRRSLRNSLHLEADPARKGSEEALRRLLQSAASFALSSEPTYREAAYRIATSALEEYGDQYDGIRGITSLVLERLGNFPTIDLISRANDADSIQKFPSPLWFEFLNRKSENSIVFDGSAVVFTDFQKRLWASLRSHSSVSVTAPTSAGKSFALQRFIALSLAEKARWCLYVVPTRALINQVSVNLLSLFRTLHINPLEVCTIPISPEDLGAKTGVYVLTQERLQILLDLDSLIRFDLAVIDEAQMLGDGGRGVILENVVSKLRARMPDVQLLFGSPQTRNPGIFQSVFGLPELAIVVERESPVAQNLIFVDTDSVKLNRIRVSAFLENELQFLANITLDEPIYDSNKLPYLSWFLGKNDKNLVFAGGPATCETIATQISQLIEASSEATTPSRAEPDLLREFSSFIKEHVHPEYVLAETILNRVAFHYGDIPAIVRRTVEDFFVEGLLDFVVCTSTLLHGVNLPAKNLFLLDPTKGIDWESRQEIPITSLEFWNLAGRAGRLGKEFEGNVFLVDHSKWQADPLKGERQQVVEPSSVKTIRDDTTRFLEFIDNPDHASGKNPADENTFVKLFIDLKQGNLEITLDRVFRPDQASAKEKISSRMKEIAARIDVPEAIIEKHISVSVFRQQELLNYFHKGISEKGPRRYIPIHPLQKDAYQSLLVVMKRIHNSFEKLKKEDKTHTFFAALAIHWMRGESLRQLIESALEYRRKQKDRVNVPAMIRSVMHSVEKDLRFRYVKFISCYCDLLVEALTRTDNVDYAAHIPTIPLYLEIGASSRTMVNLVGLGLTRTAAAIVTEKAVDKEMDRPAAERFLTRQNWKALGISPIIVREIERIVNTSKSTT
jgi:DEAD/DEAH box helicase